MGIFFLILAAVVVYLVVQNMRGRDLYGSNSGSSFKETPLDILKKRYVKGEITKEEFERTKADLER